MPSPLPSEQILNLKCPDCGRLTPRHLSAIQTQRSFDCECGFHADLSPMTNARTQQKQKGNLKETA